MPERKTSHLKYTWNNLLRNVPVTFHTFCILATHAETSPFNQMFNFYMTARMKQNRLMDL